MEPQSTNMNSRSINIAAVTGSVVAVIIVIVFIIVVAIVLSLLYINRKKLWRYVYILRIQIQASNYCYNFLNE